MCVSKWSEVSLSPSHFLPVRTMRTAGLCINHRRLKGMIIMHRSPVMYSCCVCMMCYCSPHRVHTPEKRVDGVGVGGYFSICLLLLFSFPHSICDCAQQHSTTFRIMVPHTATTVRNLFNYVARVRYVAHDTLALWLRWHGPQPQIPGKCCDNCTGEYFPRQAHCCCCCCFTQNRTRRDDESIKAATVNSDCYNNGHVSLYLCVRVAEIAQ